MIEFGTVLVSAAVFTSMVSTPSVSMPSFSTNHISSSVPEEAIAPQMTNTGLPPLANSAPTPPMIPPPVITPEPKFNLVSFNVPNIPALGALLQVNNQVGRGLGESNFH